MTQGYELCETEYWGGINLFSSQHQHLSFYQDDTDNEEAVVYKSCQEKEQVFPHFGSLDLYLDVVSPPFQFSQEEITKLASIQSGNLELMEPLKSKDYTPLSSSFRMLKDYKRKFSQFNGEKIEGAGFDMKNTVLDQKLSNNVIIQLAREKFTQSYSHGVNDVFAASFFSLTNQEARDVDIIKNLLDAAEEVGLQQYDSAEKLVKFCGELSSNKGNVVQRLAFYFTKALQEKINRETRKFPSRDLGNEKRSYNLEEAVMTPSLSMLSYYQKLPLSPIRQFTGMQVILENVLGAKKIHIIDLAIRNGMHYTVLMQALSSQCACSLEKLKITAVGLKSKSKLEKTGKHLSSFAHSLNINFSFNMVMVSDMQDLSKDLFNLDPEEVIAVYSPSLLSKMIARPNVLEHVMRVIKSINPCVMVVSEEEVNDNSPVFMKRFAEALLFYGAFFDSLEDTMDREDPHRMIIESEHYSPGISNVVAAEGEERTTRHIGINVWRNFFSRFCMVEVEMSSLSLVQASLLAKEFACGSSCSLDMNKKSLIIGWKGTPIFCVSTWKFR